MLEIIIISIAVFFTAILTFFSGFGLGTILMPVFALFFPVDIAIALTGVVHFANNIFKIGLVGTMANKSVIIHFGIPAILASFAGAWVLLRITGLPSVYKYELWGNTFEITSVKLIIAILLLFFSLFEVLPVLQKIKIGGNRLILGGVLSGFFGGLAGIQGAFRSAFLIKSGLSKEAFIATGVIIASLVDVTRLSVYASRFTSSGLSENVVLLVSATLAAIAGAFTGKRLLQKVTFRVVQLLVAVMLIIISAGLGLGII
ncbi:MAG: sulfite exporter TauE/SafE family protein [Bacteroidales bacterium]